MAAETLAALAALAGIVPATLFLGLAADGRKLALIGAAATLSGALAALPALAVQTGTGWIAAALVLASAAALAWGRLQQRLFWAAGPVLGLAVESGRSVLAALWLPGAAAGLLVLLAAGGVFAGRALRRRCSTATQTDCSALALLTGLALLAAPPLTTGWRRAAIAAEGQDPATATPILLWPLLLACCAFLAGYCWRWIILQRNNR